MTFKLGSQGMGYYNDVHGGKIAIKLCSLVPPDPLQLRLEISLAEALHPPASQKQAGGPSHNGYDVGEETGNEGLRPRLPIRS